MPPARQSLEPYFVPESLCFFAGTPEALVNECKYEMELPAVERGGEVFVEIHDLQRLWGPQLQVETQETYVTVRIGERTAGSFAKTENGRLYAPVRELLAEGCGFYQDRFTDHWGSYVFLSKKRPERVKWEVMSYAFRKKTGILHRAFYMEEVRQPIPYHLYVPTFYEERKPLRMAVVLHGLGGKDNLEEFGTELSEAAEKHGFLILSPNGYARGMHGSPFPMKRDFVPADADPENPAGLDEEQRRIYPLCEKADMEAVNRVLNDYEVDRSNVFLFGNSMGGDGTYHLGQKYAEMWRAIAPCGGGCDMRFFPVQRLKSIPVRVVVGTEDSGYELICELYRELLEHQIDASITRVGGWPHQTAWIKAIDEIFTFFDDCTVKGRKEI